MLAGARRQDSAASSCSGVRTSTWSWGAVSAWLRAQCDWKRFRAAAASWIATGGAARLGSLQLLHRIAAHLVQHRAGAKSEPSASQSHFAQFIRRIAEPPELIAQRFRATARGSAPGPAAPATRPAHSDLRLRFERPYGAAAVRLRALRPRRSRAGARPELVARVYGRAARSISGSCVRHTDRRRGCDRNEWRRCRSAVPDRRSRWLRTAKTRPPSSGSSGTAPIGGVEHDAVAGLQRSDLVRRAGLDHNAIGFDARDACPCRRRDAGERALRPPSDDWFR